MNLLGELSAAEDTGIDVIRVIGSTHKKDIVLRPQGADFRKELLYQLNIMLRQGTTVCWQQSIQIVEKDYY